MKRGKLDVALNRLCLVVLVGLTAFLALYWGRIPEEVPMHYNAAGEIDRWGGRGTLLVLPILAWGLYLLVTVVEQFPAAWNTGVKVTEENRARVYAVLAHLVSTVKFLMVVIFAWITVQSAQAQALPGWFLPAFLVLLFGDMAYWIYRLIKAR